MCDESDGDTAEEDNDHGEPRLGNFENIARGVANKSNTLILLSKILSDISTQVKNYLLLKSASTELLEIHFFH